MAAFNINQSMEMTGQRISVIYSYWLCFQVAECNSPNCHWSFSTPVYWFIIRRPASISTSKHLNSSKCRADWRIPWLCFLHHWLCAVSFNIKTRFPCLVFLFYRLSGHLILIMGIPTMVMESLNCDGSMYQAAAPHTWSGIRRLNYLNCRETS